MNSNSNPARPSRLRVRAVELREDLQLAAGLLLVPLILVAEVVAHRIRGAAVVPPTPEAGAEGRRMVAEEVARQMAVVARRKAEVTRDQAKTAPETEEIPRCEKCGEWMSTHWDFPDRCEGFFNLEGKTKGETQ